MDNVIAFRPRQRPSEPEAPAPLAGLALRSHLEEAAQVALDAADRIIAALDRIEGGEGAEAVPDPRLAAMAAHAGQAVHLREPVPPAPAPEVEAPAETPPVEPEPVAAPEVRELFPPLPWGGASNVVAAAGCAVLALVGMRA